MERMALLSCLFAAACGGFGGESTSSRASTAPDFDRLFDPDLQPTAPRSPIWSPDGEQLIYQWDDGSGDGLWLLAAGSGSSHLLWRDEGGSKLESAQWRPDGKSLLLHLDSGLALLSASEGATAQPLHASTADDEDPKLSPDGSRASFVRGGNLYVLDLERDRATALTRDGDDDGIRNGKTDWVYWEELWGRDSTGHWWSPDGQKLAFYRFDDRQVKRYPLVDHAHPYPEIKWQRYPKAGEENPKVQVGVISAGGGTPVWLDLEGEEEFYLARVHWLAGGREIAVERLNRDQSLLELVLCNAADGACRSLLREEHETWVEVTDLTRFLRDGRFVWGSERSGCMQLYLYDANGSSSRPLTPGDRTVTALHAVDEEQGFVVYSAFSNEGLGAKDRRIERVPLDGGEAEILTPEEATHTAVVAAGTGNWVHGSSDDTSPTRMVVRAADGSEIATLPASDPLADERSGLPTWQYLTVPGPSGSMLPARLLEPAGKRPGERYPVIVYHYGCPESQVVVDRWDTRNRDLWHRYMAQRGYGVFMLDNGQSVFFGREGEDRGHRELGRVNFEAQLAGVTYLESLDWVDGTRIGLWGWSGGGANTLYCLLRSPGTWKAGVAGAPVTDWRLYDSIWTERYLDHPADNADGYAASSPITHAQHLADPLLIVHGTGDDNVHPQNTINFIQHLVDAGIPFEDAIYPGQKHGFERPEWNHFLKRMTEFFDRHLSPAPPPGG